MKYSSLLLVVEIDTTEYVLKDQLNMKLEKPYNMANVRLGIVSLQFWGCR